MYGVINKSLRDMVIEQFGEAKWSEVLQRSGVPDDSFLAMQSYDDDITYKLAQSCADEMQIDLGDALRRRDRVGAHPSHERVTLPGSHPVLFHHDRFRATIVPRLHLAG